MLDFDVKKSKTSIIGLGYVGLPLLLEVAKVGHSVVGIDISKKKVKALQSGKSQISIIGDEEWTQALSTQKIKISHDYADVDGCDIVVICVPTPLTKNREPDLSHVVKAFEEVLLHLKQDALIILESTTYPGTMDDVIVPLVKTKAHEGIKIFLGYSPEREDPGNQDFSGARIPRIVSGIDKESLELTFNFYSKFIKEVIPASSCRVAEATKIYENTFRFINISFVNEMKMVFDKMGIDIWEVISAAQTKPFGFMPFYPSPGIGGHCIPIDPFYLTWKAHEYNINTKFIELSGEILNNIPNYIVHKISKAMDTHLGKGLKNSKILIIGMSYKQDVGDARESPSVRICEILLSRGAIISYVDPYIPEITIKKETLKGLDIDIVNYGEYDAVVLLTMHNSLDYQNIVNSSKIFVDTRNATSSLKDISPDVIIIKA